MTIDIIFQRLLAFSSRVASELEVSTQPIRHQDQDYLVPLDPKTSRPVILLPSELLRSLPLAEDWSDVDLVFAHNETLRRTVNEIIGDTWKHATSRVAKKELRRVLLSTPELLRDLLDQYKQKRGKAYDFDSDPEGLVVWHEAAQSYSAGFPLQLAQVSPSNLATVITQICAKFGELIEANGLNQLFFSDGPPASCATNVSHNCSSLALQTATAPPTTST